MSQETPEQRAERLKALTQKLRAALRVSSTQLTQIGGARTASQFC